MSTTSRHPVCPLDVKPGHLYIDRRTGEGFQVDQAEVNGAVIRIVDNFDRSFTYGGLYRHLYEIERAPVTLDETAEQHELRTNPYGLTQEEIHDVD